MLFFNILLRLLLVGWKVEYILINEDYLEFVIKFLIVYCYVFEILFFIVNFVYIF